MEDQVALVPVGSALPDKSAQRVPAGLYVAPRPGRTWRSSMRAMVLLSGSVGIGTGVALGWFGVAPAVLMAVGLATAQVLGQSVTQNRLGQAVMGGIAGGDLDRALTAAERALEESPSGAMRTLAAANLASVLMQLDRIADGANVLDRYPPRWPHVPVATVLWENNRAFAALVQFNDAERAGKLLDGAEARLQRAGVRGFGGVHNFRKIGAAVAGTRAMQCLAASDPRGALAALDRSSELDAVQGANFRTAERELCRAEAYRQLGRKDEALLAATALRDVPLTQRQEGALDDLEVRLGLPRRKKDGPSAEETLLPDAVTGFGIRNLG